MEHHHDKGPPLSESGESLRPSALCVVHATRYGPSIAADEASIRHTSDATHYRSFRNTVHTSLNHRVGGHMYGSWDDAPYTIIGDFEEVLERNGVPTLLNTVDTWWALNVGQTLDIPNATLVQPGKPYKGLYEIGPRVTLYKTSDFSIQDICALADHMGKDMFLEKARHLFYDTPGDVAILEAILGGHSAVPLPKQVESFVRNCINQLAVQETIAHRGYHVQSPGMWGWAGSGPYDGWQVTAATQRLAEQIGTNCGNHSGSELHKLQTDMMGGILGNGHRILPEVEKTISGVPGATMTVESLEGMRRLMLETYADHPEIPPSSLQVMERCFDVARQKLLLHGHARGSPASWVNKVVDTHLKEAIRPTR